ncbi:MAG: trypsin-like peptidase domain-containing protein [Firmicutes bacterium]|nr:trypsin-like peptidase domain-containing protein [Bacillota bacterium]
MNESEYPESGTWQEETSQSEPICEPTPEPTAEAAAEPSAEPAAEPQAEPTAEPTAETAYPTAPPQAAEPAGNPPKKHKKKHTGLWILVGALCCSLLGGALGAGGVLLYQSANDSGSSSGGSSSTAVLVGYRESIVLDTVEVDTSSVMTAAEVYAANVNATVGVTTSVTTTNIWGQQTTSAASGSGFIITADGYIVTNYHVIEDATSITVSMYNGDSYSAIVVGYDESNDIAVLKVEAEGLSAVILGDSDNLNVGDSVVAIGNPLGELTYTLTAGIISAKDREVTMSTGITMNLLQTDCAINSGNSGGPLFNMYGEVIGITNAKYSSSSSSEASIDNIGFAIPINSVMDIIESIIEKGYVSTPYIGVSVYDVSAQYQMFGLPQGAAVVSVTEGSPAEEAGLQANDIITHVNGTEITGSSDLKAFITDAEIGDELVLTVYRQGETLEITVTVGEQIQSATSSSSESSSSSSGSGSSHSGPWG